jgi:hypothetical protein
LAGGVPLLTAGGLAPGAVVGGMPVPAGAAVPKVIGGIQLVAAAPSRAATPIAVTVNVGASPTVIDLGTVFAKVTGIRSKDGLHLALLGNTNSRLVKTGLSEAALTLTFTPGMIGKATITVSATDADGVSVQETLVVTVLPRLPVGLGSGSPVVAGGK